MLKVETDEAMFVSNTALLRYAAYFSFDKINDLYLGKIQVLAKSFIKFIVFLLYHNHWGSENSCGMAKPKKCES